MARATRPVRNPPKRWLGSVEARAGEKPNPLECVAFVAFRRERDSCARTPALTIEARNE